MSNADFDPQAYREQLERDTATNRAIQPGPSRAVEPALPPPQWLLGATAAQDAYQPVDQPWLPDVGRPLIPSGGQFSPGVPAVNRAADDLSRALTTPKNWQDDPNSPVIYQSATNPMVRFTQADIDRATDLGMAFSGGGLATKKVVPKVTEIPKAPADAAFADPKLRAKAEALRGKYPQYAEAYPEVGPPALMAKTPDPKEPSGFSNKPLAEVPYATMDEALAKGAEPGFFLSKKKLPEVEQFQKDRNIIQRDLDLHGYDPYFDPAKRFDVDPTHYGPFADTAVEAAPKTAKTQAEWEAKYGTDEIRARLQAGFEQGKTIPDSDRWYLMGQLEKGYIDELGEKAGREAFKREFADMMAATTGGANPYDNYLMSHYANYMAKRGERLPERSFELPFPIGGQYAPGNIAQAQKYIDAGQVGFNPGQNPKRYDFSSAYLGNKNAGTIDEQMMSAYDPKVAIPQWYGPATKTLREEAAKAGVDARGFQDVGWAGIKKGKEEAKGKTFEYEGPMINHINRSIETTHRLTGMPRDEIFRRGVILKQIPMYGLGTVAAAPVLGAIADQGNYK